jgi:hypothetical protein
LTLIYEINLEPRREKEGEDVETSYFIEDGAELQKLVPNQSPKHVAFACASMGQTPRCSAPRAWHTWNTRNDGFIQMVARAGAVDKSKEVDETN